MTDTPDIAILHDVDVCEGCACSLEESEPVKVIKRQVFDIPKQETVVTDHQVLVKRCPNWG